MQELAARTLNEHENRILESTERLHCINEFLLGDGVIEQKFCYLRSNRLNDS